jgi:hypothetical protein
VVELAVLDYSPQSEELMHKRGQADERASRYRNAS